MRISYGMNLHYLRSFVRVAEAGSLSRAAEHLQLSQPALSRQMRLLEEEMGVSLLRRTGRGVVLTPQGTQLRDGAYRVLEEVARLSRELEKPHLVSGQLSLGIPPSAAATIAGPLVERYHREYPAVALRVVEDLTGAIQDALLSGQLDLGILYEGVLSRSLHTERIKTEELVLVGQPNAGLSSSKPIRFESLSQFPMVLPGPRHGLRAIVEQAAFRAGIQLNTVIEVESLPLLLDFVHRGLGYTILSKEVCESRLKSGHLSATAINYPTLNRAWVLAWRKDVILDSAAAEMIRAVKRILER